MSNYKLLPLITLALNLVLSTQILDAQNIKGIVLQEKSNKPIVGANVFNKNIGIGTTTNDKGEYYLNYAVKVNNSDTITFSFIGYKTQKLSISELKQKNYVVILSESVQPLDEVSITAEIKQLKLQIAYTKLASMKDGLYSYGSALIGDKIWIIGGDKSYQSGRGLRPMLSTKPSFSWESYSDKHYIYDIPSNKWTTSNMKFCKRAYHCIHYYNDKVFVLGGKTLSTNKKKEYLADKIEVYNIKENTIITDNTNPHQAVNFASFIYNDNLIVMGGSTKIKRNEEKECTNKSHLLNLKTGLWYELNNMPYAKETKGILVNNTIFLIGGYNLKPLDNIETYNITTGEWKILGQMFYGVERPALAFNENIIYIFEEGRIQTLNIDTNELKMFSIDLPLKNCEFFYKENKLYILGGCIEDSSSIAPTSNLYCIDLNEFKTTTVYSSKIL